MCVYVYEHVFVRVEKSFGFCATTKQSLENNVDIYSVCMRISNACERRNESSYCGSENKCSFCGDWLQGVWFLAKQILVGRRQTRFHECVCVCVCEREREREGRREKTAICTMWTLVGSIGSWDLSDIQPCQNMAQGRFMVGSFARIKTHAQQVQKYLNISVFPWWDASSTKT